MWFAGQLLERGALKPSTQHCTDTWTSSGIFLAMVWGQTSCFGWSPHSCPSGTIILSETFVGSCYFGTWDYGLVEGWANLGPWGKFGLLCVFLNKILLEHMTFICLLLLLILFYFYYHLSPLTLSHPPPATAVTTLLSLPMTSHFPFHISCSRISVMQQLSQVIVKQTIRPAKPKVFPIWPFKRKLCHSFYICLCCFDFFLCFVCLL